MPDTAPLGECGAPAGGQAQWLHAADGVRLRLAIWPGERPVLILPGRTEYIEKYGLVVADLAAAGRGALVVDWRGQGLADRVLRDPAKGHIGHFAEYQRDLEAVLGADGVPRQPLDWLAHSMGGCTALRGLMRGLPCAMVAFSAPMLGLSQPRSLTTMLSVMGALTGPFGADTGYAPTTGPRFGLPSMDFATNNLTHDPQQFARMKAQIESNPRLALGGPTLRWMAASLTEMRALAVLPSPRVPALFGLGGDETIVSPEAIRARVARWPGARLAEYPAARHELLMERAEVRTDFLRAALALFDSAD